MGVVQMNSNPLAKDFNTGSLLKFAFPTISMMLFMGLYTIVDTIFVSRFVNTNALSAINIVCPVINLIVGLGTMIATGGSAIVARKMGAGEPKRAKQDFTLLILFGFILGVVIFILGIIFIDEIIYTLGADKVLFPYCKDYLTIILLFTPASMLQVLFQNLFVTAGKPTLGLVLSVSAGVMNIVFDYLFMVIFDMGIAGAGFGTGIGYLIPAITGLIVFCKKSGTLSFVKPIIDIKVLGESCINGSSEMVSQLSTAITTFFFNRTMMNLLGVNGVASITIIIYTQFLLTTLFIGFSMGVAPVISYNFGANNYYGLKKIYKICISFIFVGSLFIFALSFINGNTLVRLFTGTNEAVYKIAINGFMIFVFSFLFSGFNIFSSAIFTALSNGKLSALIFSEMQYRLASGDYIKREKKGAVINANLANQNELKVGDTIELSTENGTKVSVQIIGIFMSAGNAEKDQPSKTTAVNRIENQVFIDNSTYKELFKEAEFEKLCVYSKRPEKLDVLETSLQKIFGNDVELSTSDTLYQQMSAPLEQISKVANLMLVLTLITGTVVVSLLLCMWMRTRQKEVAIFMSLGKTKSEIFLQTLLEAGSVFTLSVLGATAIGKLFSGVLQNVITGSETVTENLKVVLQVQDIGMLFLLGGAVILVALCCSILPILRANPKDILAKMEG